MTFIFILNGQSLKGLLSANLKIGLLKQRHKPTVSDGIKVFITRNKNLSLFTFLWFPYVSTYVLCQSHGLHYSMKYWSFKLLLLQLIVTFVRNGHTCMRSASKEILKSKIKQGCNLLFVFCARYRPNQVIMYKSLRVIVK